MKGGYSSCPEPAFTTTCPLFALLFFEALTAEFCGVSIHAPSIVARDTVRAATIMTELQEWLHALSREVSGLNFAMKV